LKLKKGKSTDKTPSACSSWQVKT